MARKPLLKHTHIVKLGRLLNMMYRPTELAEELGDIVRDCVDGVVS